MEKKVNYVKTPLLQSRYLRMTLSW